MTCLLEQKCLKRNAKISLLKQVLKLIESICLIFFQSKSKAKESSLVYIHVWSFKGHSIASIVMSYILKLSETVKVLTWKITIWQQKYIPFFIVKLNKSLAIENRARTAEVFGCKVLYINCLSVNGWNWFWNTFQSKVELQTYLENKGHNLG